MGWKEEKDFHQYRKAEKKADRMRKEATKEGMVCSVCGRGYYEHKDYGEIKEHGRIVEGKQWVKL